MQIQEVIFFRYLTIIGRSKPAIYSDRKPPLVSIQNRPLILIENTHHFR